MKFAIIGRTEILYEVAERLTSKGYQCVCILTSKESPEYTKTSNDFRLLSERYHVPFAQGSCIQDHYDFLNRSKADIAVSINYTGVVPQSVIDLFPLGVLNAHGGDLPRYRGNACQAWAILNGEESIGLCIHRMIGGELDSGDIIARDYLAIDHNTKVTYVWEWMSKQIPELMLKAVQMLNSDPAYFLEKQSQNPEHALRCYPRMPEDGHIDWSKPAIDVLRLINASNKPYPGAFCNFEDAKLTVWDAELVSDTEIFCAVPGQITTIGDGFVEVACSYGKLRVVSVEYRGELMSPSSIITSIRQRLS